MKEGIIPGCGNCTLHTAVCEAMFDSAAPIPTQSIRTLINPPGLLEGPPTPGVPGLICGSASNPEAQKNCSQFTIRTKQNDIADENY